MQLNLDEDICLVVNCCCFDKGCNGENLLVDHVYDNNATVLISHYQCVKHDHDDIVMKIGMNDKGFYTSSQILLNARNAGLRVQLAFSPCRTTSP